MATEYHFVVGKAKWAKLDKPDQKYGFYGLDLYMDEADFAKYKTIGLNLKVHNDDEGTYVRFRRDPEKLLDGMDEKPKKLIFVGESDEGKPIYKPFEDAIGNGSLVTVKISVYDSMKGKGHRLEAVAVENLVEYTAGESDLPF